MKKRRSIRNENDERMFDLIEDDNGKKIIEQKEGKTRKIMSYENLMLQLNEN